MEPATHAVHEIMLGEKVYQAPYSSILRPLTPEEFQHLYDSIAEHGIQQAIIVTDDNRILDGYHRLLAAQQLEIPASSIPTVVLAGLTYVEQIERVVELNVMRRQLTEHDLRQLVQKLRLYHGLSYKQIERCTGVDHVTASRWCSGFSTFSDEKVENVISLDGRLRPAEMPDDEELEERRRQVRILRESGMTIEEIAEKLQVSIGTVHRDLQAGIAIMTTLSRASAVGEKLESGIIPDRPVVRDIDVFRSRPDDEERISGEADHDWKLITGNPHDVLPMLPDGSIDLIIAEPEPAEVEFLAVQAARLLPVGGSLILLCEQYCLPDVLNIASRYLRYWWCMAMRRSPVHYDGKGVFSEWKPAIWLANDSPVLAYRLYDLLYKPGTSANYDLPQDVAALMPVVAQLAEPGMTVMDPYCRSDAIALASVICGRSFIGIHHDADRIEKLHNTLLKHAGGVR